MASIYSCTDCGSNLNLNPSYAYPPDFYFEAGNKDSVSFSAVDTTKLFEKEDKMICNSCGHLVGYIYDDGPPLTDSPGQFHMGPSQVIPRAPRYRFKKKALRITSS